MLGSIASPALQIAPTDFLTVVRIRVWALDRTVVSQDLYMSGFDRSSQSACVRPSHFIASERAEWWAAGLVFRFAQSELVWLGNASVVESSLSG